ncbi:hypothetical protein [Spiroplasma endosymbiont of Virgichneumon dumeticola]|uniref:hypothetical protein n=1 Tax=Spiroplasma endosymbiont of Virgichneumon dumeticola TaxID=3139323 RepID=UPI0035C88169
MPKKDTNNLFKKIIDSSINKPEVFEQSQWDSWMNQTETKKDNWYKSVKEKFEQNIKNWVKIKKISEEFSLFLNELFDKNKNIEKDLNLERIRIEKIRNLLAKSGHLIVYLQ